MRENFYKKFQLFRRENFEINSRCVISDMYKMRKMHFSLKTLNLQILYKYVKIKGTMTRNSK